MIALCLLFLRRRSLRLRVYAMVSLLALCGMALSCGSKGSSPPVGNPGTPAGSSTITIAGTSGSGTTSILQTAKLSVVIQ
jgi:hypothetical protein